MPPRRVDQLQLHLVRAIPCDRVGPLWVLHAKSVPRNGLWEGRDLEFDADEPRPLLPNRAIDAFNRTRPPRGTSTRSGPPLSNSISPLISCERPMPPSVIVPVSRWPLTPSVLDVLVHFIVLVIQSSRGLRARHARPLSYTRTHRAPGCIPGAHTFPVSVAETPQPRAPLLLGMKVYGTFPRSRTSVAREASDTPNVRGSFFHILFKL
jgi:hypothetical protein